MRTADATNALRQEVAGQAPLARDEPVAQLVSAMLWSAQLQTVKRYYDIGTDSDKHGESPGGADVVSE